MIDVLRATERHVAGIAKVCTDAYWATYRHLLPENYIQRNIRKFYHKLSEKTPTSQRSVSGG